MCWLHGKWGALFFFLLYSAPFALFYLAQVAATAAGGVDMAFVFALLFGKDT
jgi:hypothetical protein